MLFIFKEYLQKSTLSNKKEFLIDIIGDHSIVHKNKTERMKHIAKHSSTIETIFDYYNTLLHMQCHKQEQIFKNRLLNIETDFYLH